MTDKLSLYNGALSLIKERRLATVTDDRPERYHLDDQYDKSIQYMLSQGFWKFAKASVAIDSDTDVEPEFGPRYAFTKPTDLVRMISISEHEQFWPQLESFSEDNTYWFADCDPLYVSYVSNGVTYGYNLGRWTPTFILAVEYDLAVRVAPTHTAMSEAEMRRLRSDAVRAMRDARSKDAMSGPAGQYPPGRLTTSRATGVNSSSRR